MSMKFYVLGGPRYKPLGVSRGSPRLHFIIMFMLMFVCCCCCDRDKVQFKKFNSISRIYPARIYDDYASVYTPTNIPDSMNNDSLLDLPYLLICLTVPTCICTLFSAISSHLLCTCPCHLILRPTTFSFSFVFIPVCFKFLHLTSIISLYLTHSSDPVIVWRSFTAGIPH